MASQFALHIPASIWGDSCVATHHCDIIFFFFYCFQVCICSISIPEAVWNQRTSTNSIPGTLQGQNQNGTKKATDQQIILS